jgi:hypothetical protein
MANLIKKTIFLLLFVFALLSTGNFTFAATGNNCPPGSNVYQNGLLKGLRCDAPVDDVETTITAVKNLMSEILLPAAAVIFSIMFLSASILYITSSGNQQRIDMAKKTLTTALIGLLMIVLAEVLIGLFASLLGGNLR